MKKLQTTRVYAEVDKAIKQGYDVVSAQGSSRSSKTYNIVIWLVNYLISHRNTSLSIVRGTLPALKGSVYRDVIEILIKFGIYDEKKYLNKTEMIYHLPNGSWIEFFSTDNEQKIRGRKRDILYVNEANEITNLEWKQLKMRTTKFAIIDYNPSFSDDHWIFKEVNKAKGTYNFISTYKDNPFLEQVIVDEIEKLRTTNPSLWRIYGLGLQAVVEGLIFKNIEIVDKVPALVKWRRRGIDLGFTNDPSAIVDVYKSGKEVWLDEICYRTEMLTSDIIHELKPNPEVKIICESADPRMIKEIHRAGLNIHAVKKGKGSIEAGITSMLGFKIHITRRSVNVIREFKNYTYMQDKDGKWLNTPIDTFNHAIDAIRYVFLNEILGGDRKPINKRRTANAIY